MVSRVAKAIFDYQRDHQLDLGTHGAARAAIEAMREPTEEMIDDALQDYAEKSPFMSPFGQDGSFASAWRAMISSALQETPEEGERK